MNTRRRLAGVATAVGVIVVLCGCSVPQHGRTGYTRDSHGTLTAVIQMCGGHQVDGIEVFIDDHDSIEYQLKHTVSDFDMEAIPGVERKIKPELTYYSYAGSSTGDAIAPGPDLSREVLRSLVAGQVLAPSEGDVNKTELMTVRAFRAQVKRQCSGLG